LWRILVFRSNVRASSIAQLEGGSALTTTGPFCRAGRQAPRADCADNDGNVGIVDFLALLGQWTRVGTSCDFGGGAGITDFLELLGRWGAVPVTPRLLTG